VSPTIHVHMSSTPTVAGRHERASPLMSPMLQAS
jgi:hypothetical protein